MVKPKRTQLHTAERASGVLTEQAPVPQQPRLAVVNSNVAGEVIPAELQALLDAIPPRPLLTVAEVVAALRLGKSKVYGLLNDKAIVSVRMGESIRVPREAVVSYLRRCYQGG
jgi:excisionase family DNA binding protein